MSNLYALPPCLVDKIFEYSGTYRESYERVVADLNKRFRKGSVYNLGRKRYVLLRILSSGKVLFCRYNPFPYWCGVFMEFEEYRRMKYEENPDPEWNEIKYFNKLDCWLADVDFD